MKRQIPLFRWLLFAGLIHLLPGIATGTEWHVTVNGKGYTYDQYKCKVQWEARCTKTTLPYEWAAPGPMRVCPEPQVNCTTCYESNMNGAAPSSKFSCVECGANKYGSWCATKYPLGTGGVNGNGMGTLEKPWSLEFALSNPPNPDAITAANCCDLAKQNTDGSYVVERWIQPGDIIWVHGGDYTGYQGTIYQDGIEINDVPRMYTSYLHGSSDAPIIVRAYGCEKPVINSTGKFAAYIQNWDAFNPVHSGQFTYPTGSSTCCDVTIDFKNPNYSPDPWLNGKTNITSSTLSSSQWNSIQIGFDRYRPRAALEITGSYVEFWDLEITSNTTERMSLHGYNGYDISGVKYDYTWWFQEDAFNDVYNPQSPSYCNNSCQSLNYFDYGDGIHIGGGTENYQFDFEGYANLKTKGIKLLNLTIHDMLGNGIQAYDPAVGHVFNGCLVYNNGFNTTHNPHPLPAQPAYVPKNGIEFRPAGHGMYMHNGVDDGVIRHVKQNISFNNAANGIETYQSGSDMYNYELEENICMNSGSIFLKHENMNLNPSWQNYESWNMFVGQGHAINYKIQKNHLIASKLEYPMLQPPLPANTYYGQHINLKIGHQYWRYNQSFTIRDNFIVTTAPGAGEAAVWLMNPEFITFENNMIYREDGYLLYLLKKHQVLECTHASTTPYQEIDHWQQNRYYQPCGSCNFIQFDHNQINHCNLLGEPNSSCLYYEDMQTDPLDYSSWTGTYTDIEQNSTHSTSAPSADEVYNIINTYDPGRVHIQAYDWDNSTDVSINLDGIVPAGRSFSIRNAQDPSVPLSGAPSNYSGAFSITTLSDVEQPNGADLANNPNLMVTGLSTGPHFATYIVEFFPYNVNIVVAGPNALRVELRDNNGNLVNANTPNLAGWFKTLKFNWSKAGDPNFCNVVACNTSTVTTTGPAAYSVTISTPDCKSVTVSYEYCSEVEKTYLQSTIDACYDEERILVGGCPSNSTTKWFLDPDYTNSVSTDPNLSVTLTSGSRYVARCYASNGCPFLEKAFDVMVSAPPDHITHEIDACYGQKFTMQAPCTPSNWYIPSGFGGGQINVYTNTTYSVKCRVANGCPTVIHDYIFNVAPPEIVTDEMHTCAGTSTNLNNVQTNLVSAEWFTFPGMIAIPGSIVAPASSTNYFGKVTDNNGCISHHTVSLTVHGGTIQKNINACAYDAPDPLILNQHGVGVSCEWRKNGTLVNGFAPQNLPPGNHIYEGKCVDAYGCTTTVNLSVNVIICNQEAPAMSTDKKPDDSQISVQPNPAVSKVNVTLKRSTGSPYSITVRDYTGKEIIRIENIQKNECEIDLSAYPAGVYLIQVQSGDKLYSKKIIKQ